MQADHQQQDEAIRTVTVRVPETLWRRVAQRALDTDSSIQAIVIAALTAKLEAKQ